MASLTYVCLLVKYPANIQKGSIRLIFPLRVHSRYNHTREPEDQSRGLDSADNHGSRAPPRDKEGARAGRVLGAAKPDMMKPQNS